MDDQRRPPDDLERDLRLLAERLAFPPTPDLAAAVVTRLHERPPRPARVRPRRPLVWIAAALLLLAAGAWALSPGLRESLADALGLPGLRIEVIPGRPAAETRPLGTDLLLGQPVSLDEAIAIAGFPVSLPTDPRLGAPEQVYAGALPTGDRMVSVVYAPGPGLSVTAETGVGLLLMQFPSRTGADLFVKEVSVTGTVREVVVGGSHGFWISGASSLRLAPDTTPARAGDAPRTTGNILMWEAEGIVYRLESNLSQAEAIAVAESLAPAEAREPPSTPGGRSG